jgi:TetR/AcrR family transcriptional regulator
MPWCIENERLQQRMNLFFDKIESVLRQSLRDGALGEGSSTPGAGCPGAGGGVDGFCRGAVAAFHAFGISARADRQA